MIYDLESKSARELREIVKIQMEEYQALQKRIAKLEEALSKCERVMRVPDNENTAHDYDLQP